MTRLKQTGNEKLSKAAHNATRVTEGFLLSGASSDSGSKSSQAMLQALCYNSTSLSEFVVAISHVSYPVAYAGSCLLGVWGGTHLELKIYEISI